MQTGHIALNYGLVKLAPKGHASLKGKTILNEESEVFHDSKTSEILYVKFEIKIVFISRPLESALM